MAFSKVANYELERRLTLKNMSKYLFSIFLENADRFIQS